MRTKAISAFMSVIGGKADSVCLFKGRCPLLPKADKKRLLRCLPNRLLLLAIFNIGEGGPR